MSLEDFPARASASFSAPDASLTIGEFCRAEKISRSMRFYRVGERSYFRLPRSGDLAFNSPQKEAGRLGRSSPFPPM